jgi:CBS domain-containing protein
MRIRDVLQRKGDEVVTITPSATIGDLVRVLGERNIGAAVVSSDGTTVDGIVSERDVVRALSRGDDTVNGAVSTIMTRDVSDCDPGATIDEIMQLMTEHRIRHVPVVMDGRLIGIVSIGDVVKMRIGELELEREQLSTYISS